MAGEHLTGNYWVRAIGPAFRDVFGLMRTKRDVMEVRSQAIKLRYWPERQAQESGQLIDLEWCWVRALSGLRIGELRLDDAIGGRENLRIIFYVGDRIVGAPLPTIWILRVMQKKRNDFSSYDLDVFKGRRILVLERFYRNPLN